MASTTKMGMSGTEFKIHKFLCKCHVFGFGLITIIVPHLHEESMLAKWVTSLHLTFKLVATLSANSTLFPHFAELAMVLT